MWILEFLQNYSCKIMLLEPWFTLSPFAKVGSSITPIQIVFGLVISLPLSTSISNAPGAPTSKRLGKMSWMRNASANFRCLAHELNWELPDVWVDFPRVMLRLWAFECRSLGMTLNWIDHFFVYDFIYIRYVQYAYIYDTYIYISSCHWTLNILGFTISSPPPAQKKRIQEEGIFTKRVGDQQMDCCMSTSQWSFRCFLVGHTNLGPEKGRYHCGGERGSATGGNPFRNFAKYAKNIILFQEFGGWHMLIHYQGCYNIYLHRGPAPRNPSKSLTSIKSIGIWHNATGVDWPFSHHKSGPLGPLGDELSFCFQVSGSFCTQPFCVGGTMIMGLRHFLLSNNQETKCYTPED